MLYSCLNLNKINKDAVVVFLPADSFVQEEKKYQNALQQAGIEARSAISISFEGFEVPNLDDLNINWLC